MAGRPDDQSLCAYCAGEQVHPYDRAQEDVVQRDVPRYRFLGGFYDSPLGDLTDGQHGMAVFEEKRAEQRRRWGGR
jgi:hypothetical protein